MISKHCARRPSDACQTQLFKTLRLTPARLQPDVTFRNQASGARFHNYAPDVIFCDHASDVQYESGYVACVFLAYSRTQTCGHPTIVDSFCPARLVFPISPAYLVSVWTLLCGHFITLYWRKQLYRFCTPDQMGAKWFEHQGTVF